MSIYILESAQPEWADYGDILIAGMSEHLGRRDGLIQLERTGPFVPPITFPGIGDIVVTDAFRQMLESSDLTGISFQPIYKARIVHLEWEKWDWQREEPEEYPETAEPEDYILERPHSPELAAAIGDLWELYPQERVDVKRVQTGKQPWEVEIMVVLSTWDGTDWFRGNGYRYNYVSERAKVWLE
jgi:hypothetical protein